MRKYVPMLALAMACSHPAPSTPPASAPAMPAWSDSSFAANVRAVLAQRYPGARLETIEEDRLIVHSNSGQGDLEVSFAKAHAQCRSDWPGCGSIVERTLAAMTEAAHPGTPTRAQLRVVLRANGKVDSVKARAKTVTVKPFSSDAQWLLAVDMPDMIRLDVSARELGMSDDDAWKIATANVKPKTVVTQTAQGFVIYQDDYAPSALLYPDAMLAAARQVLPGRAGNLLAVCPEENIVLYTIGGSSEAAQLRDAAASGASGSTMPLSSRVMEWTDHGWREARL